MLSPQGMQLLCKRLEFFWHSLCARGLVVVFWLLFNYKYAIIPVLGFLMCWEPIRNYCPVNFTSHDSKDGIKVTSFNVCGLVKAKTNDIVDYF